MATQLERYNDMNSMLISVWENSAQVHYANRLLLPTTYVEYWTQPMSAERPEVTLGRYFLENNFCISQRVDVLVRFLSDLHAAAEGGVAGMVAYEVDPAHLVMKLPRALAL